MSNVISFPVVTPDMRVGYISPKKSTSMTRREYLEKAKMTLESYDYEQVLCSILDVEYYEASDHLIRRAVDDYYELPNSREE